ncbi:MAG: FAD-binding oxidoreductase [Myxococcaceae bacterium]|nr:FAD-binding oxidoreductase [Myxococcaceae bacterium]
MSSSPSLRHALGPLCVDAPDGLYASPKSARELADVLAVLRAHGARLHHDVRLSRGAFDRLEAVDPKSCTVQAGAGIVLAELERQLQPHALSLGPLSPAALKLTLADFLEGPYAGLRAIPVGRLEPLCASLVAVLHDGKRLETHFSPRSAAGPDLAALVLGAHGRIGLVLSARLRCVPLPEAKQRARLSFPSVESALDALKAALGDGCVPAKVRAHKVSDRAVLELELEGAIDAVARDLHSLQHRAPLFGGRPAGADLAAPGTAGEHECSWQSVARALATGHAVDLYRLSLHGAVVAGGAGGLMLDAPARWANGSTLAAPVLGGAP